MKNNYLKSLIVNIYSSPSAKSEITSQILYGEKFKILSKNQQWFKIKTNFDNYIGFIKKSKFNKNFKPTHKIYKLKSKVYKKIKGKFLATNKFLPFASGISFISKKNNFVEFEKNLWIKKSDLKRINHYEKNYIKILKLFLNSKYLWGGKTYKGIDCSALIQIYFYYNRIFFPRDSKDQIKFCKKIPKKTLGKGSIIFWKGHVGMCISQSKFIHAYGPKKKVVIMPTNYTIKLIKRTANLVVKKISYVQNQAY